MQSSLLTCGVAALVSEKLLPEENALVTASAKVSTLFI